MSGHLCVDLLTHRDIPPCANFNIMGYFAEIVRYATTWEPQCNRLIYWCRLMYLHTQTSVQWAGLLTYWFLHFYADGTCRYFATICMSALVRRFGYLRIAPYLRVIVLYICQIDTQATPLSRLTYWHGCICLMTVVCCQVGVSASGRSLVQSSPTECVCYWVWSDASVTLYTYSECVGRRGQTKKARKK